jgi:hypothetical protein
MGHMMMCTCLIIIYVDFFVEIIDNKKTLKKVMRHMVMCTSYM